MPKKKRPYRRRRRPRRGRRRAYPVSRIGTVSAPRLLSGFPASVVVKLRYVDTGITIDPTAGGMAQHVFRANSCFDPDYSSIGHQPCGYDEWSSIYNTYTVLGAKFTLKNAHPNTANATPGFMGVMLSSQSAGILQFSDINNLLESKLTGRNVRLIGNQNQSQNPYGNAITKKFSARRFFGVQNLNDGDAYSANIGANPAELAYFCPWVCSPDGASNPGAMVFACYIDYIVMFKDPKVITGS